MGERRSLRTEPWRASTFEEVQEPGEFTVKARLKVESACEFVCGGGREMVVEVSTQSKSLFPEIKNKGLMVKPLKTRVIQATSKTEDWIMQGQFLLLTFQSFNSLHLPWGRMIRKDRNV